MTELEEKICGFKRKISIETDALILSWIGVVGILFISNMIENMSVKITLLVGTILYFCINVIKVIFTLMGLKKIEKNIPEPSKDEVMEKVERTLDRTKKVYIKRNVLDFLKCFPKEHPYYVLSITGLYLSSVYVPYTFDNMKDSLSHIPLIGNIYATFYSPITIVMLFFVFEYIEHIVNYLIRLFVKIHAVVLFPIIFSGFLSGLIVWWAIPLHFAIYLNNHEINLAQIYNNVVLWFGYPINSVNVSLVFLVIIFLLRTSLFASMKEMMSYEKSLLDHYEIEKAKFNK